eukprot:13502-Heterococcus_DN1.PRE.3
MQCSMGVGEKSIHVCCCSDGACWSLMKCFLQQFGKQAQYTDMVDSCSKNISAYVNVSQTASHALRKTVCTRPTGGTCSSNAAAAVYPAAVAARTCNSTQKSKTATYKRTTDAQNTVRTPKRQHAAAAAAAVVAVTVALQHSRHGYRDAAFKLSAVYWGLRATASNRFSSLLVDKYILTSTTNTAPAGISDSSTQGFTAHASAIEPARTCLALITAVSVTVVTVVNACVLECVVFARSQISDAVETCTSYNNAHC